jgi:hypothetical protein
MEISQTHRPAHRRDTKPGRSLFETTRSSSLAILLALSAFHLSLVSTSAPLLFEERDAVDRAIDLLDEKGFKTEVFLLRNVATFKRTDNWLNRVAPKENAFAATNFPFLIITVYPDFYSRATDDTERAMVLLHEAQHLRGKGEREAYEYVWRQRARLGWTQLTHGTTEAYVTIEQQTRENAPALFTCPAKVWSDCTETLNARR